MSRNQDSRKETVVEAVPRQFDDTQVAPHLHFKTFVVLFVVALTWFAQVSNLVGVGAFGRDMGAVVAPSKISAGWKCPR